MTSSQNEQLPLPPSIQEALESMSVTVAPASIGAYPPMVYKSLPELQQIRASTSTNIHPLARDVLHTIASLRTADHENLSCDNEYLARIAAALLLLGHSFLDEAHDLVSPLSWPNELPFAYGPPVALENEEHQTLAAYVHGLVHRAEGPNSSEFGMTGFSNANYWAGTALRSPLGAEAMPLPDIRAAVMEAAASVHSTTWCQQNLDANSFPAWDPRLLNELCKSIADNHQHELAGFASKSALAELRILLVYTLRLLGYQVV